MQERKNTFEEELGAWLDKSDYVFLADFQRDHGNRDRGAARHARPELGAEFHVVKNRILKLAASDRDYPRWMRP
jgi:ribosomal protein L10